MQLFVNNWSATLTAAVSALDEQIQIDAVRATELAELTELDSGDYYVLTLALVDGTGKEVAWEIVHAVSNVAGLLSVERGWEDTDPLNFPAGTEISARLTARTMRKILIALENIPQPN